ncbi:hypothetical protein ABPG75_009700 [Micractinium tetrahymenae]
MPLCCLLLQDLLLLRDGFQQLVLRAFRQQHAATVAGALRQPPPGGFDSLDYFVDGQSRQVLQFAALHALSAHLQAEEVLAPAQLLPQVSRVLLQTEEAQGGRMLEAVAGALAAQMHAGLLLVDAMLLATLASDALGKPPEAFMGGFSGAAGAAAAARAAPALRLAWRALQGALLQLERPTVVFIRSAEQLLCSSFEAHDAFLAAFGPHTALEQSLEGGAASRAPLVLLGGLCADESPAALAGKRPQRQPQPGYGGGGGLLGGGGEGEEDADGEAAGRPGSAGDGELDALDDELGLGDLLLSLSKLAGESQRPNARKLLLKVFPTRVKLQPPPAGPAAARHLQRLQQDAAEAAEEENFRAAAAAAASTGVSLPPKSSGLYAGVQGGRVLSKADWRKVLSWAVAMQTLQEKQRQLAEERRAEEAEEEGALAALQHQAASGAEAAGETGGGGTPGPGTPSGTGLRRRRQPEGSDGGHGGEGSGSAGGSRGRQGRQQASIGNDMSALAAGLWGSVNPLQLAAAAAALPWRLLCSAGAAAFSLLGWLPLVGGYFEQRLSASQLEAELRELEAELEQLEQAAVAAHEECDDGASGSVGSGPGSVRGGRSGPGSSGTLRLSEAALRYGLGMLQRSSGSPKAAVEPSNRYEKRLLEEVVSPEECGRGFSEVGALEEAKTALREAVQLPLKHPELFAGGTLARPSKGVLLFGPPGTGKTLVARAAAAECGAAFLSLSTASLTSKWFGDSTKLLRAAFTLAAKLAPCVIFIDEVDALLGKRNSLKEHEALREMKNEMMALWDGIRPGRERVMVLGATNRPFDLDDAVLRRFTHRIFLGLPDRAARAAILRVVLEGERLGEDVSVDRLAELTSGYSGSDLKQLCVAAAMRPVRAFLEAESSSEAAAGEAAEEAAETVELVSADARVAGAPEPAAPAPGSPMSSGGSGGDGADGHRMNGATSHATAGTGGAEQPPAAAITAAQSEAASGSAASSSAAATLRLVPRLGSLLRQAERIASVPRNPKTDLRPLCMKDFEEALKEVGASVNPDSAVIQELNEWNAQYGTTGSKAGVQSKRLSYYS